MNREPIAAGAEPRHNPQLRGSPINAQIRPLRARYSGETRGSSVKKSHQASVCRKRMV